MVQEPAIAPFSWSFSSHCTDPHDIPTSFATPLVVICLLACTSSFTFEFASAVTEVEGLPPWGSSSSTSCSLLKQMYQSCPAAFLFKTTIQTSSLQGFQHFYSNLPKLARELDIGWLLKLRHCAKPLGHTFTQSLLAHDWQVPVYSHCSWTSVSFQSQTDLQSAWGRDFFCVHTLFEEGLLTLQPFWTAPLSLWSWQLWNSLQAPHCWKFHVAFTFFIEYILWPVSLHRTWIILNCRIYLCTKAYVTFWLYFVWAFCTYRKLN